MTIRFSAILLAITFLTSGVFAGEQAFSAADAAVSADASAASAAVSELRSMGPTGLDALFVKYAASIDEFKKTGTRSQDWDRIANALDTVAMQKDAYSSQLYWYTDIEAAKRAAKAKGKPILTLRLLGDLNQEFSCANSRLFRAVLYSNADVSKYLRDNYILHWRSVRPAPRITIDFGDGRKIERTITGNSIHYILDPNGKIIDALPGLYGPTAFLSYVRQASEMNSALTKTPAAKQQVELMKYRKANFDKIVAGRTKAVSDAGVNLTETRSGTLAILAAPMAVAKMIVVDEFRILRVYDDFAKFEPAIKFDDWDKLGKLYAPQNGVDANSVAFVRRQNAKNGLTEEEFKALFAKLDSFIALDTTRNDFLFHSKLYEWLNRSPEGDLEDLNARVYDQIFQTPNSDKWLGLYSNDVYTALDGNGVLK